MAVQIMPTGPLSQNPLTVDPRIRELMMQQQGGPQAPQAPMPPMGVQDDLAAKPPGGMLTGADERALQKVGNAPAAGLEGIMAASSPTAGTALAKGLAAAYARHKGGKEAKKEEAEVRTRLTDQRKREADKIAADKVLAATETERVAGIEEREIAVKEKKVVADQTVKLNAAKEKKDVADARLVAAELKQTQVVEARDEKRTFDRRFKETADIKAKSEERTTSKKFLELRLKELEDALGPAARLSGNKVPEGEEEAGFLDFFALGTGSIPGMLPSFNTDTERMEALGSSEALTTIGKLETPLTPVSDKDMETIMGRGISQYKSDKENYRLLVMAIEASKEELGLVNSYLDGVANAPEEGYIDEDEGYRFDGGDPANRANWSLIP